THYIGELHYEDLHEGDGPQLQLIQHEEGRIVPKYGSGGHAEPVKAFDYQYHLTDHLGNVRVTYSTTPEKYEMVEDFEDDQSDFTDLKRHNRRTANRTTGGSYVSAVARQETSAMTLLRLNKGDVVNLSVYASYENNADEHAFLPMAYRALFSSFDEAFGGIEGISGSVNEFNEALNSANMMGKSNAQPLAPRAYLNYLFFDKEMHYVTAGYQQISKTAGETDAFERVELDRPFVANQEGYILAYLSNEDQAQGYVYFDDFTVYHEKTMVVSSQDYYPFGSQFNSHTRTASVPNKYKYQGMELQPETETYLADFRSYDPAIGRWQQVDPKANEFHSPYAGMGNNPIMYYDFLGDTIVDANGAVAKLVNNVNEQIDALNSVLNNKDFNYDKLGFSKKQVQSKVKALKGVLSEINRMKVSAQVYHVQNADDQGAGVSFDAKTGAIDIRVNASSSIGLIGHELLHGFQFENGDLSLFKDNSAYGSLYDIGDETAGYNRERLLDGGIGSTVAEKRTDSWTRQTGAKMTPQAYQKLPNGPININSPQGKAIQKKLRQGTSKEVVIGWKNYDRSK
ncbi:MAG: RHS repeat-associated core domain-containing protein, partial [Bacteroidota bacterium]